jgi:hypothetical protein
MKRYLPLALLLTACPIGNNRFPKPVDLTPGWLVDKLRVLAIRADPPEIRPGETATFEALVIDPDGTAGATIWIACPPEDDDGVGFGCGLDGEFDFTEATPDELAEAGFIGFEPVLQPRFLAPPDTLDGLDEREAAEGVYVLVQVATLPQDVLDGGFEDGGAFDFNEVEVAYKRVIVSDAPTPNNNPEVAGWFVEGVEVPAGTTVEFDRGQEYEIGIQLQDGSVEVYQYLNPDGDLEERTEEPYLKWYTTGGNMVEDATLFPFLEATWRSPEDDVEGEAPEPTEGTFWAVVRDRRGGFAWSELSWKLRE